MILGIFDFISLSFVDILDILLVAVIIFTVFKWIKGSSAINILTAIIILFLVKLIVVALDMKLMSALMGAVLDIGVIALIILFQPEIRHFLFKLGSNNGIRRQGRRILDKLFGLKEDTLGGTSVKEIAEAVKEMSEQKVGALIVLTKRNSLQQIIETGDIIDAAISKRLILNIFFKNSPLHDGAMVIGSDRIVAARCTLPITARTDIPAHMGMRHKAAIGITEECDAHVIVVSEETGRISYVKGGEVQTITKYNQLKALLGDHVAPEGTEGEAQQ